MNAVAKEKYNMLTCIHNERDNLPGLCPSCQEDHDTDPGAWLEYGGHRQGIENWRALQEEMAAHADELRGGVYERDETIPL